jgi:putative ABC transport system permease protein
MRTVFSPLSNAWTSIASHKLRSFLTILGVVIGVAAVISLMSIGKGTEAQMLSRFTSLGTNLVYVSPGASSSSGGVKLAMGSAGTLTLEDAEAILEQVPDIVAVAPNSNAGMQIIAGSNNMFSMITGVTPEYQQVFNSTVASGNFIDQYEYDRKSKVALIGPEVAATLFGENDPVGQKIRMGSSVFTVIGVLESTGASMMGSTDYAIYIPLSTLQGMMSKSITTTGQHIVSSIALSVTDQKLISTVKDNITYLLQVRHNVGLGEDNDFTVTSMDELTSTIAESMQTLTLLLGAIAGISLLVGGIGVMNIMLVSVMERRREIGIRKALGAKERDIWGQFLFDSALLTLTGGIIGVLVGWGGSYLLSRYSAMPSLVTADIVILAVAVSVGIGLFFGFYPAWQGSRLDPIQALRAE